MFPAVLMRYWAKRSQDKTRDNFFIFRVSISGWSYVVWTDLHYSCFLHYTFMAQVLLLFSGLFCFSSEKTFSVSSKQTAVLANRSIWPPGKKISDYAEHFNQKYFKYTFSPCVLIGIFARSLPLHHQKFQLVLVAMAGRASKRG